MNRSPGRRSARLALAAVGLMSGVLLGGCRRPSDAADPRPPARPAPPSPPIVAAAREQVGRTVTYDPTHARLDYPGGDVPLDRGVCTDVIIRALRDALGMDLQRLVHEDMHAHFGRYPRQWGLTRPDANIDHRRVPNLRCFFRRQGWELPATDVPSDYLPGDIVTCTVPAGRPHIMIVSDRTNAGRTPLVIHNLGAGAREDDALFAFPLTGHYRVPAADPQPDGG